MSVDKVLGQVSPNAPGAGWFAITPNDATVFDTIPRCIYVGTTGNLAITSLAGENVILKNVPVGYHPIRPITIKATGTTATDIVGIY